MLLYKSGIATVLAVLLLASAASAEISMQISSPIGISYETTDISFNWSYNETLNFSSYTLDSNCNNYTDTGTVAYGNNITLYDPFANDEDPEAWGNGTSCVTPENCTDADYSTYGKGILPDACAVYENYTTYDTPNQPAFYYKISGAGTAPPYWRAWCMNNTNDWVKFVEEFNWSGTFSNGTSIPPGCVSYPKPMQIYTYQYQTPGWYSYMHESNTSWDIDTGNFSPSFTDDCIYTLTLYGNGSDGIMASDAVTFSIDIPQLAGGSDPRITPPGSIPPPSTPPPSEGIGGLSPGAINAMTTAFSSMSNAFIVLENAIVDIFTPVPIEKEARFVRAELWFFSPLFFPFSPFHLAMLAFAWGYPISSYIGNKRISRGRLLLMALVTGTVSWGVWAGIQNFHIIYLA